MKKKSIIIAIFFIIGIFIINNTVQANFEVEYTKDFLEWTALTEEEKQNTLMPSVYSVNIPDGYYESKNEKTNILSFFKRLIGLDKASKSKYVLSEDIDIEVKNQGSTSACWAFSILSSMETNMALRKKEYKQFSERHMVYATARNFKDGENTNGLNKKVNEYGLHEIGLAYLTNGQGSVLEENMPFENNEDEIYLSEINKKTDAYVSEYEKLPSIYKSFDSNGNITYNDGTGNKYTKEMVEEIRKQIKQYIVDYGAISTAMLSSDLNYYNNSNPKQATAYFCDNNNVIRDHGVVIIGWDDNYKKENFNEKHRPKSDGAYIILNSYGEEIFNNGILYVSYEDVLIENNLFCIKETTEEQYNNLYQHDFFGGVTYIGNGGLSTGYYANIYERNTNENEILNYVGVTVPDYVKLNIYVNPKSDSLIKSDLIKVATTEELNPGYHKIAIDEINLSSDKFSIVVEQISENNRFYFSTEARIPSSIYDKVSSKAGNSKISLDGKKWYDLTSLNVDPSLMNLEETDVCIKGFTKFIEEDKDYHFKSDKYEINENYVKNIEINTNIKEFMKNVNTNQEIKIYDNNVECSEDDIIKTGMKIKVGEKTLKLVVIGDVNSDGKISLIDISKLILHYNEDEKNQLENEQKQAADINLDGKISLIDISKLIQIYNEIN